MLASRRAVLGMTAAGIVATAVPARAQKLPATLNIRHPGRNYSAALGALRDYAAAELQAVGLPGMTISLVDNDGFAATMTVGYSDVDAKLPVAPDQLFQIGSISKSITCLCLHAMADKGMVDLGAPVSHYLPGAALPAGPITLLQLMNHTGGFPHDAPAFPHNPDGKLWSGFAPGSRFSYSNIGYGLLGMVIAKVAGKPHPEVIHDLVLAPLGMTGATAHLLFADRPRYATGYVPFAEDRPLLTKSQLITGPFTERDFASGAVAASGEAMLAYLRYVLVLGRGKGGPLMSDNQAKMLLARDMENDEFGPGSRYASGFASVPIDGKRVLHHTGGMTLFSSSFHADPVSGVACFASVNGRLVSYRPRKTTAYAVQLMRAARDGAPLPAAPDPLAFRAVEQPEGLAGHYVAAEGPTFDLSATAGGLRLTSGGAKGRVEASGKGALATDHPGYSMYLLNYEPAEGRVAQIWWGDTLFRRDVAAEQPRPDPALTPLTGAYIGTGAARTTIFARGNALHMEGTGELVRRAEGFWSPTNDPGGVTRIWFNNPIGDRCYELCFCGAVSQRLS